MKMFVSLLWVAIGLVLATAYYVQLQNEEREAKAQTCQNMARQTAPMVIKMQALADQTSTQIQIAPNSKSMDRAFPEKTATLNTDVTDYMTQVLKTAPKLSAQELE